MPHAPLRVLRSWPFQGQAMAHCTWQFVGRRHPVPAVQPDAQVLALACHVPMLGAPRHTKARFRRAGAGYSTRRSRKGPGASLWRRPPRPIGRTVRIRTSGAVRGPAAPACTTHAGTEGGSAWQRRGASHQACGAAPVPWAVMTGPEGGYAPTELDALGKLPFATLVGLGPRVLRADTAAVAALACWQAILGDGRERPPSQTTGEA